LSTNTTAFCDHEAKTIPAKEMWGLSTPTMPLHQTSWCMW
jgi:hypothetical protein